MNCGSILEAIELWLPNADHASRRRLDMVILVTGAAGYIGSIVIEELVKQGSSVIALDNLSQGYRQAVAPKARFIEADLADLPRLDDIFSRSPIDSVIHLAADSRVGHSMSDPSRFFQNNVICGVTLLDTMLKHGVDKLIFSSSAAVYGEPSKTPIREGDPKQPINPYGESKLMFERILYWYGQAYGLKSISLRYFNAAGASGHLGECHDPETHLVPSVLKFALGQLQEIPIYGTNHSTPDGSCIRDYIHVSDIARAHILALKRLPEIQGAEVYNLGNGKGYSVLEVIEAAKEVTGTQIRTVVLAGRIGDPAVLIASAKPAQAKLGWQPKIPELKAIIDTAWQWMKKHPYGYRRD